MVELILLDIGSRLPLSELWGTAIGFITIWIFSIGAIGLGARNLSIGSLGAYCSFVYLAIETQIGVLQPLLWVSLVLVMVGTAAKLWRAEGLSGGAQA